MAWYRRSSKSWRRGAKLPTRAWATSCTNIVAGSPPRGLASHITQIGALPLLYFPISIHFKKKKQIFFPNLLPLEQTRRKPKSQVPILTSLHQFSKFLCFSKNQRYVFIIFHLVLTSYNSTSMVTSSSPLKP